MSPDVSVQIHLFFCIIKSESEMNQKIVKCETESAKLSLELKTRSDRT